MSFTGTFTVTDEAIKNRHVAATAAIERSKLEQRVLAKCSVVPTDWRVWDALQTVLPGTPANDDLGLVTGTWGSSPPPYLGTGDLKAAGATTRRARVLANLPPDYEAGQTVTIRVYCGMITTAADTSCTVDVEAWRVDKEDGTLGAADLVTTAATTMNSTTADDRDFVVTATTLLPGDTLDIRLSIACNDAATATAVIGAVYQVEVLADLR